MPNTFKRGAKVTFAIRRSDGNLRAVLLERIEPMVRYLASELAELALARFQAELDRMGEAFEVAVSAFASATDVRGGEQPARAAVPEPAAAAEQGSTSPSPPRGAAPNLIAQFLGPEIDALMKPAPPARPLEALVDDLGVTGRGKPRQRPPRSCSKCGRPGARADQCGKGHEPLDASAAPMTAIAPRRLSPTPAALELAKRRAAERNREALRETAPPEDIEREPEDDQDDDLERWSAQRIAEERELAEANKREGELPVPRSSWTL